MKKPAIQSLSPDQFLAMAAPGSPSPLSHEVVAQQLADSIARLGMHEPFEVQITAIATAANRLIHMAAAKDKALAKRFSNAVTVAATRFEETEKKLAAAKEGRTAPASATKAKAPNRAARRAGAAGTRKNKTG